MYVLDCYAPKEIDEHINKDAVKQINAWYDNGHKKPLLIHGSTGIGKSTLVYLFAKQKEMSLFELTPSEKRDKENIEKQSKVVSNSQSLFSKKNLLFFDNIDVFFGDDRGGLETIVRVAKEATNPVVFVANDIYKNKKMLNIRNISDKLTMKKSNYLSVRNVLKKICVDEGIKFDENVLKYIAQESDGDIRSAILDLDFIKDFGVWPENVEKLGKRERKKDVFKTVLSLFKSKTFSDAVEVKNASDIDYNMLYNWIVENLHLFYDSEKLKEAYELVSLGDLNKSRIYIRQNWTFLKYFLMLGVIAPTIFDKKDKFNFRINFPTFIRKMGKETSLYAKNKKASTILKTLIHTSKRRITSDIEFYRLIFSDKEIFGELAKHIDDDEKKFIVEYFKLPKSLINEKKVEKTEEMKGSVKKEMKKKDNELENEVENTVDETKKKQKTLGSFFS